MSLTIFDLFKVGIGPSSSHTVGPMIAANRFVSLLRSEGLFAAVGRIRVELYGSLAMTGKGHATDTAVMLGLLGETPEGVDPDQVAELVAQIQDSKTLQLGGEQLISFDPETSLIFNFGSSLPRHPNGMRFYAYDAQGIVCCQRSYYSVGGGFVMDEDADDAVVDSLETAPVPYSFNSGEELLALCRQEQSSIADIVLGNELARLGSVEQVNEAVLEIWQVMDACIRRGCEQSGELPGGINVKRRAPRLHQVLTGHPERAMKDHLLVMDWVSLYALAVNEENAAGGRVVTAPTNGAAGVIPAVLAYYDRFIPNADAKGIVRFLATAAAIGMLYKQNASISAAEVGCQGEIGVACSMAAGALCAVLGGTNEQVCNAAEIGMEHNLGLTCDPVAGLVQVPCIERNAMGAMKAINAARLALHGDGEHRVSLDSVIETMHQTGLDMQEKYKETSTGGLAVNVVAC
ncbi:L-serine ammonia-lyase [Marinobacterium sp. YM272]|uniref:L-serine ammonia-lyase n=1 Tax=Marinobacterium sp. YM272 TaxID=3421654 RepID=UPI003D7FFA63